MAKKTQIKMAKYEEVKALVESIGLELYKNCSDNYDILEAPAEDFMMIYNGREIKGHINILIKEYWGGDYDAVGIFEEISCVHHEVEWVEVPEVFDILSVQDGKLAVTTP